MIVCSGSLTQPFVCDHLCCGKASTGSCTSSSLLLWLYPDLHHSSPLSPFGAVFGRDTVLQVISCWWNGAMVPNPNPNPFTSEVGILEQGMTSHTSWQCFICKSEMNSCVIISIVSLYPRITALDMVANQWGSVQHTDPIVWLYLPSSTHNLNTDPLYWHARRQSISLPL